MARRDSLALTIEPDCVYVARADVIDLIAEHSARDLRHFTAELEDLHLTNLVDRADQADVSELQRLAELHQRALTATLGLIATRDPSEHCDVSSIPRS